MQPNEIQLTPVIGGSGNIAAIGYDSDSKVLVVQFAKGDRYAYQEVPPRLAADFLATAPNEESSTGKFFHAHIRTQAFQYEKLPAPELPASADVPEVKEAA